jgi:hypothetical protein
VTGVSPPPSGFQYLLEVEADGAAELEAGELAPLSLVQHRRRRQAEVGRQLAGGEKAVAHAACLGLEPVSSSTRSSQSLGFHR